MNDTSVLRLSHDRANLTWYRMPLDLAGKNWYTAFSVTPSGRTWLLEEELDGLYVFGFDSDGKLSTQVKVDTPGHLSAGDFMVSDTGQIFIAGYFREDASKSLQGKHFQAIFEKSGKLVTEMKPEDAKDVDLKEVGGKLHEGAVAWGPDGNFYFLRPDQIVIISPMGEVVRRIPFQKPIPKSTAGKIELSGGLISLGFVTEDEATRALKMQYLVLDNSGNVFGAYTPSADVGVGNQAVCFSEKEGYTFLTHKNKKIVFTTALLR